MAFSIICLGLCSLIAQFVLLRELTVSFQGNELSISIILFSWLIGSSAGGFLGRRFLNLRDIKNKLAFLFIFNSLWFYIGLFSSRGLKLLFHIPAFEIIQPLQILLICVLTVIPLALSLGLSFIFIARIIKNPVKTYSLESLGAFLAGMLSLVLVKYVNSSQILWIISTLSLIACLQIGNKSKLLRPVVYSLITLNFIVALTGALSIFQNYSNSLRFPQQKLIASVDSIYENIAITKIGEQSCLYENGRLSFSNENTEAIEEFGNMVLLSHPAPKKILLVGSGFSGILQQILKHPVESIDYTEPDSKLISTALEYIPYPEDPGLTDKRIKIYNQDPRFFVKNTNKKYDLVILNSGGPVSLQSNRFYTIEFFKEIKRVLNPGGWLAVAIDSKEDILAGQMLQYNSSIYKTLESEFKDIQIIPGERMILIASVETKPKIEHETLKKIFMERNISAVYFTPEYMKTKLDRQNYITEILKLNIKNVTLNRDYSPHGFLYYLGLKAKQSSLSFEKIWAMFGKINFLYIIGLFAIITYFCRKNIIKITIITTGFFGISIELIIALIFQINFGLLYYTLGAIIASFMLGLFSGSMFIAKKTTGKKIYSSHLLIYFEVFIGIISIASALLLKQAWITYFLLTGLAGFLIGCEFGLFCRLYPVSTVYSLDLAGACLGSISTGIILIPVFGIYKVCLGMALVKFTSIYFLKKQLR